MDAFEFEEPRAIPILTCERSGKVHVDTEALTKIFRSPKVQDKEVCIVSVSGAFRKGKSFMLNFFVRYLRNRGYENSAWMGQNDEPLKDGFEWRGGRGACTNGILIWSEVFTVQKGDKEIAILLMDTQGLFDNRTDNKTNSIIFALSTLISSVQIFNLTQQIQETDLGFLQFFTAYAQAARQAPNSGNIKPFQSLIFLVRDWPYATELSYGTGGGAKYLDEVLSDESASQELSSVRKYLRSSFEEAKCCLMPHPGEKVATTSQMFTGCLTDIKPEFLRQTAAFVDSLFRPNNLVVKTINGHVVSALAILQYVSDCGASLTNGKLPDPKTMMETVAEAQNFEAQKRCSEKYNQNMKEALGESFVEDDFLREMHIQASSGALGEFADMTKFGSEESRRKHRDYLQATMKREYGILVQVNRGRRLAAESEMLNLIECIAEAYEDNMKGAMDNEAFLPDDELEKIHGAFANEAYEAYSSDSNTNSQLKDKYFEKLQAKIERIYEARKAENDEKRRIAEEQDERVREMMKLELQCAINYREKMRKLVDTYADDADLDHSNDGYHRTALDEFEMKAIDVGVQRGTETWQEHHESLKRKLSEEYEEIKRINAEKKVNLEKALETQRNKAYVEYEGVFQKLLKDTYLEKNDLLEKHRAIVCQLMDALLTSVGSRSQMPLVAQHLREAEDTLNEKYTTTEKWNEKNNTFLRKVFRVVKSIGAPLAGLLGIIGGFKNLFKK